MRKIERTEDTKRAERPLYIIRRQSFILIVPLVLALALMLSACGPNTSTSTSSNTGSGNGGKTPTPPSVATVVKGYGLPYGCPSDAVVNTAPSIPNIKITMSQSRVTVTAHNGDSIEIDLPFGISWGGPTASQGVLTLQHPAGYAWKQGKTCVWRFVAQGTGTTQLKFYGRAICEKNKMCPQFAIELPFTINVK